MFPFNATPTGKPRSTELMSRSLAPQYDGLSYGLIRSQIFGDYNRNFVNDMSRSLAICNLKDNGNNTVATTTILPTVEEVLYEETALAPPRTLSPAANIISPQSTHRNQSPKQSVTGPQSTNNNVPSSSSYDGIGQQHLSTPKSVGGSNQFSNSHTYKQTNGTTVNENGTRSPNNNNNNQTASK
jgi:hypothetical protein